MNDVKKKTILKWFVRTTIAVAFFVYFWEYTWTRYILIAYVPLNLFGIVYPLFLLNKFEGKVDDIKESINDQDTK